jgi:hypothetical protein
MYERSVCGAKRASAGGKKSRVRRVSVYEAGRAREGGWRGGSKRENKMLNERKVVRWTMLATMEFAAEDRPVDRLGGTKGRNKHRVERERGEQGGGASERARLGSRRISKEYERSMLGWCAAGVESGESYKRSKLLPPRGGAPRHGNVEEAEEAEAGDAPGGAFAPGER